MSRTETIVVGVDGSEAANLALRYAGNEAELRQAPLRVVCAWELPTADACGDFPPLEDVFACARRRADEIVDDAVLIVAREAPSVACDGLVVEGQPASVLLRQSANASLLVVGKRGRGGFASLLLGSVCRHVVNCAFCPVVVVPLKGFQMTNLRHSDAY